MLLLPCTFNVHLIIYLLTYIVQEKPIFINFEILIEQKLERGVWYKIKRGSERLSF